MEKEFRNLYNRFFKIVRSMPNCSGGIGEVKVKDGVNLTKYCLTIKKSEASNLCRVIAV